jgi:hypothetical protein
MRTTHTPTILVFNLPNNRYYGVAHYITFTILLLHPSWCKDPVFLRTGSLEDVQIQLARFSRPGYRLTPAESRPTGKPAMGTRNDSATPVTRQPTTGSNLLICNHVLLLQE